LSGRRSTAPMGPKAAGSTPRERTGRPLRAGSVDSRVLQIRTLPRLSHGLSAIIESYRLRTGAEAMLDRIAEFFIFGFTPLVIGMLAVPAASSAAEQVVRGEVVYRERIALPPGALVTVQLADVSLA